jgi:3-methyladenine DNA glycosylase/8-oxoguanine DNA glycosylase
MTRGSDAEAVAHLRAADPELARVIDAVGPFRMQTRRTPTVFAALAEAIVYQQLSTRAAQTIYSRVCALFPDGDRGLDPAAVAAASDDALRGAGLSRAKLLAMRDLADRAVDGRLPTLAQTRRMSDEVIMSRLVEVRGIGRWTAEMFLMFRLARPDVLPVDDLGIRRGFAVVFGLPALPTPDAVTTHGERWRPYRTAASWYLWRAAERGGLPA